MNFTLGIDIGASKIAIAVFNFENGEVVDYLKVNNPNGNDAKKIFDCLVNNSKILLSRNDSINISHIGAGCPGPIDFVNGRVSPVRIPAWKDFELKEKLENSLGKPVFLESDSVCFTLAEFKFGAAKSGKNIMGIVVSSGIGAGLVLDGNIYHGHSGNAGQIGHVFISDNTPNCPRGTQGCLTAVSSGFALRELALDAIASNKKSKLTNLDHNKVTAKEIAQAANNGDALAKSLIANSGKYLGRTIAIINQVLDLDHVIIGGGLSNSGDIFWDSLNLEYSDKACINSNTNICKSRLGDKAGVIGAAILNDD